MNKKIWILIGLIIVLILIVLFYKKQFHLLGDCKESVTQEPSLENHQIKISVLDCGATTDYSTHVSIKDDGILKQIVVIKGDHSSDLKLSWVSLSRAKIEYSGSLEDAFNFNQEVNGLVFELSPFQ